MDKVKENFEALKCKINKLELQPDNPNYYFHITDDLKYMRITIAHPNKSISDFRRYLHKAHFLLMYSCLTLPFT